MSYDKYSNPGRRTLYQQLIGNGPGSTRTQASINMAQRQVDQAIRNGDLNRDGTRR